MPLCKRHELVPKNELDAQACSLAPRIPGVPLDSGRSAHEDPLDKVVREHGHMTLQRELLLRAASKIPDILDVQLSGPLALDQHAASPDIIRSGFVPTAANAVDSTIM